MAGMGYVFWIAFSVSMIVSGATYHNRLLERLVHPFTYFQIPFSAAFFQMKMIPEPYRGYLLYSPLPNAFELVRYGAFEGTTLDYVDIKYMTGICMVMTLLGLIAMKSVRNRIHLN
jgi:capsular polysaccharide transport system permease protein